MSCFSVLLFCTCFFYSTESCIGEAMKLNFGRTYPSNKNGKSSRQCLMPFENPIYYSFFPKYRKNEFLHGKWPLFEHSISMHRKREIFLFRNLEQEVISPSRKNKRVNLAFICNEQLKRDAIICYPFLQMI